MSEKKLLRDLPYKDDYTEEDMEIDLDNMAELLMSGNAMHVNSKEVAVALFDRVHKLVRSEFNTPDESIDILGLATKYISSKKDLKVKYVAFNKLCLDCEIMPCFTLVMTTTKTEDKRFKIDSQDGVFSYVYNFLAPDLSELGYTFFEHKGRFPKRIG